MPRTTLNQIRVAFRKLKRSVYYDKTDLHLRRRLAKFECDSAFEDKLKAIHQVLLSSNPVAHPLFRDWVGQIGFRIVPKSLQGNAAHDQPKEEDGKFLSNDTSSFHLEVSKVNYFFDGPIELHLIAVLWIMVEGWILDRHLAPECCGSRLEDVVGNEHDASGDLFVRYHELYARWRDTGIKRARQLLEEEQKSVCILGLDVQQYYYSIRVDYHAIADFLSEALRRTEGLAPDTSGGRHQPGNLLVCLREIHCAFRLKIRHLLTLTNRTDEALGDDWGIPIGLCSSAIFANWHLWQFDEKIKSHVRPAYYGRYVDDVLIVVPTAKDPSKPSRQHAVANFLEIMFVRTGILREPKGDDRYEIIEPGGLFLQQSKCILQFFDAKHSIAGLNKFQKKLEENASDFLLLPVDEADNSLEEVAYELLYEGSVNKFRSVKGMAENRYELAKHLARQTILHLLTDDPPDPKVSAGLLKFFKGRNAIEFYDLWERVFTFFVVADDGKTAAAFARQLKAEIKRVKSGAGDKIAELLADNLKLHLELSRGMADALGTYAGEDLDFGLIQSSDLFRKANLMRHHFVRVPLLNYTGYQGPLLARSIKAEVEIDEHKQKWSPRFVNFDECVLLANSDCVKLRNTRAFEWAKALFEQFNGFKPDHVEWVSVDEKAEVSDE